MAGRHRAVGDAHASGRLSLHAYHARKWRHKGFRLHRYVRFQQSLLHTELVERRVTGQKSCAEACVPELPALGAQSES